MVMPPMFELRDVCFEYDGIPALHRLSVQIAEGESVALLGANGSGKSTLLRILDALYFPSRGQVSFSGQPLTPEALHQEKFALSFRRRVALVFQNPDVQLFNPTVFDEVAFGPLQMQWSKEEVLSRVSAVMELMGIGHLRDRPPYRLSGGEKKRVALASVIVLDPDVLLLSTVRFAWSRSGSRRTLLGAVLRLRFVGFAIGSILHRQSAPHGGRSEEHTSELQSLRHLVCRLL